MTGITVEELAAFVEQLERDARAGGYILNPDRAFLEGLAEGLLVNIKRYGYPSCPCRRATGDRIEDQDIICPCDYRDADVTTYGACYCGLYVSAAVAAGEKELQPIPERRPAARAERPQFRKVAPPAAGIKVWRCRVCGYLCAREEPPDRCPICKVDRERFEVFSVAGG